MEKLNFSAKMELNNDNLEGKLTFDVRNQTCTIEGKVKDNDLKFRTTMKLLLTGGEITADEKNQVYRIKNADQVTIIMAAETDYKNDYPTYRDKEKNLSNVIDTRINDSSKKSYDELKQTHIEDHQSLFDRVSLDLGEFQTSVPTDQLIDEYRNWQLLALPGNSCIPIRTLSDNSRFQRYAPKQPCRLMDSRSFRVDGRLSF